MQRSQQFRIMRQPNGTFHIAVTVICDKLPQSRIVQEACTKPRSVPCSRHRYNGQPHAERLTGRSPPRIGVCIEDDVHIQIVAEIILCARPQLHARGINACMLSSHLHPSQGIFARMNILEEESGMRRTAQDLRPEPKHFIRDLGKVVKTAKDDGSMRRTAQVFVDAETLRRRIAEMRLRKAQDLLRKECLHPRRIADGITENIIHRGQPRRIEVTDARKLHRSGLICRNLQRPPACRMPRKIKENIHLIRIDALRCFFRGKFG